MMRLSYSFVVPSKPYEGREFRVYKRRRLKQKPPMLSVRAEFDTNNNNNVFDSLIRLTQFPSLHFDLITPALGFASGLALSFSRWRRTNSNNNKKSVLDIGEWILFATPTPFNRLVFLRCPSISFHDDENVNERLVREERHYVTINSGRIQVKADERDDDVELLDEKNKLNYQRVCVSCGDDGGVISLDWPSNLELEKERGLDSTLLLVPGTPQGSMDPNIMSFVVEALKRGFFPIVMNPRGCAASPLTTPR